MYCLTFLRKRDRRQPRVEIIVRFQQKGTRALDRSFLLKFKVISLSGERKIIRPVAYGTPTFVKLHKLF